MNKLGLIKNIDIWPSYGPKIPIIHIRVYVFWPIGLKLFIETQEIIIYRLVLKNPGFGPYLLFSIFLGPKKGCSPQVWGLKTKPKS